MRNACFAWVVLSLGCAGQDGNARETEASTVTGSGSMTLSMVETSAQTEGEPGSDGTQGGPTSSAESTSGVDSGDATTSDPSAGTQGSGDETGQPGTPVLPPANASLDYQLGGAYPPPAGVQVLSRDRNDAPAAGLYNICYVNGYQTQPDEEAWWLGEHPDLLLRDDNGDPFIDPDWDEILLDITTDAKRQALATIVGGWITQCGADGFDAVEIDNLDTYSRSNGMISQNDAVAFIAMLSATAHEAGMAIAQKNSTEIAGRRDEMGTDFAVAEECNRWSECADYKDVYGDAVFVIEYRQQDFDAGCSDFPELSIVLRDLQLVTPGSGSYVFDGC